MQKGKNPSLHTYDNIAPDTYIDRWPLWRDLFLYIVPFLCLSSFLLGKWVGVGGRWVFSISTLHVDVYVYVFSWRKFAGLTITGFWIS